jgi:hypothetical protein
MTRSPGALPSIRKLALTLALAWLLPSSDAAAQWLPPPETRVVLNNLTVLRLNPVGLEDQIRLGWQQRIADQASPFLRDNFLFVGIAPRLNPAFIKIGPSIEVQPFSLFNLRVGFEYIHFFSTFGFLQSFGSAVADYDDKLLAVCASKAEEVLKKCVSTDAAGLPLQSPTAPLNYPASGVHLMIEPTLQGRFGPVAIRNKLAIEYWYMRLPGDQRVFYDVTLDTLVPGNGWVVTNDLDVLFVTKFRLMVGARYSIVKPIYEADDYRFSVDRSAEDNTVQRLGPLLYYTFFDRGYTGFNKPTLLLVVNWYVDHRYRRGQAPAQILPAVFVQHPAMPYIILGFSFQSDFINRKRR